MNKKLQLLVTITVLFLTISSFAQTNELLIPKSTSTTATYLNVAITNDVTANGGTPPAGRIYVLERDGVYFINTTIRNDWPIRIKAKDGTGKKPIIYLTLTPTGGRPSLLDQRGDVYLKDLVVTGYVEYDPTQIGNMPGALVTLAASGFNFVADGCVFSNTNGNHIRTNSAPKTVKCVNCTFANMGYLGTSNLGAGKAIDLRNVSVDSLILLNNTFVNYQDRIVRHYQSTAGIKTTIIDHNTIVNGMSYHGMFVLGKVGKDVTITNNLFLDNFALGDDKDVTRLAEFVESKEKDPTDTSKYRMTWIFTEPNDSTKFTIKGNYYGVSAEGQAFFTKNSLKEASPLTWHINKKLGADSVNAFKKISITLPKIPKLMVNFMEWYISPTGGNRTKTTTAWNSSFDYDRKVVQYFMDTLNCKYSTSLAAYTGTTDGLPAGDLNWFPEKKGLYTDVEDITNELPTEYKLDQNYPNPFNPTTVISYSIPNAGNIRLSIYNLLGQEVATLVNMEQNQGKYQVTWNGKDNFGKNVSSGVYFYQLKTNNVSISKKMLLMK